MIENSELEKQIDSKKRFVEILLIVITLLAAIILPQTVTQNTQNIVVQNVTAQETVQNTNGLGDLKPFFFVISTILAIIYYLGLSEGWYRTGWAWIGVRFLFSLFVAALLGLAVGLTLKTDIPYAILGAALLYYIMFTLLLFKSLEIKLQQKPTMRNKDGKYYFFDTSALVSIYHKDEHTITAKEYYFLALEESGGGYQANHLVISSLFPYEATKVLAEKNSDPTAMLIEKQAFQTIHVSKEILVNAIQLIDKYTLKDSFDAIQLACALKAKGEYGQVIFVCFDKKLRESAKKEGLEVSDYI